MSRETDPLTRSLHGIVADVIEVRNALRDQGQTELEIARTTGRMLRERWPAEREWKYLCVDCGDTGWKFKHCTDRHHCGRPFHLHSRPSDDYTGRGKCTADHAYMEPCRCTRGREIYEALRTPGRRSGEDFTQAGKTTDFKRAGRR